MRPRARRFSSDTQAVNDPSVRIYGTQRRNVLRGPGIVTLSLSKTTPITERLKLEIRGDFFNILNYTAFQNSDTNPNDVGPNGTFGQITNTGVAGDARQRIIQPGARLSF